MRSLPTPLTRARVTAVVVVAVLVIGTLLLNLRVDRLWANFPDQPGPCLAQKEAACRHGYVN